MKFIVIFFIFFQITDLQIATLNAKHITHMHVDIKLFLSPLVHLDLLYRCIHPNL